MQVFLSLLVIIPMVLYVFVSIKGGYKAGLWAAMGSSVFVFFGLYFLTGQIDETIILEVLLIVLFGLLSLKFKDPVYFKFQPVVTGALLALFLAWFQIFSTPYLVLMTKRMAPLLPQAESVLQDPRFIPMMGRISHHLIWLLFFHAGFVAYAALKWRDMSWMFVRLSIFPLLLILFYINAFLFRG